MKKIFQFILVMLTASKVFSQTFTPPAFAEVDNNYRNYVNNVFGALESNRVTTGLLADYGFDFTDPKIYNGVVLVDSTLMEQGIYSELYKTIFTSRFNNNITGLRHPNIHDSLCYIARQKEVITLSGLLFKYNAIDPNAQATGKMQTVNGQLKDVYKKAVWQNPYQEFTTVAISPSTIIYNLTYCSVKLPANLFMGNMLSQINNIQFDAADGQGYRNIAFDVPINLNYADTGWKHWVFKITLTNGQLLYSHSKVHFNNTSNLAGSGGGITNRAAIIDQRETITATEQFNGAFGMADIIISYRSAADQVLRRPLIVAEGLDPGRITHPEEPEGDNTFDDFINSIRFSGSDNLRNLISNDPSQYDIIYINWRNGTDWLQRNELVLEEVIRWVNAHKQPLGGVMQPNVVLGSSMGGVIARMALGRMDRAGGFAAHQTNLYISLDAPHQGANVPLGYQAAARHAIRMYVATGPTVISAVELVQLISNGPSPLLNLLLADQPASRQLLTNRIDLFYNTANGTNQQFMQELRTQWAYPVNIRNIAISNGSECATDQEFAAGSNLLYHYRSTKTRFITDIMFMAAGAGLAALNVSPIATIPFLIPGSSKFELTLDIKALANGGGNQVYYGNVKLTKKVLWLVPVSITVANKTYNAPTGLLPFDSYPGGFYTVTLANQPGSVSQDWMFTYNNSFFIQRRFSFIPTTSALDIGQGNTALTNANYLATYIGETPPAPPFNTPFINFSTGFNPDGRQWISTNSTSTLLNNEPHEGFFIRSSNWLAGELNGNINGRTNCNAFCSNGVITGNTAICAAQTLTAPFGNGAIYNWTVSPLGLVNPTPNGNSVLLTRIGASVGQATLSVDITGVCGLRTLSIPITVGGPQLSISSSTNGCNGSYQIWNLVNNTPNNGTNWSWTVSYLSTPSSQINIYSPNSPSTMLSVTGGGTVSLSYTDLCGVAQTTGFTVYNSGCFGFRVLVSPNPAKNNMNVSFTPASNNQIISNAAAVSNSPLRAVESKGKTVMSLFEVNTTVLVKQWNQNESKNQNYNLSISGLRKGVYVLQVDRDNQTTVTKILIE